MNSKRFKLLLSSLIVLSSFLLATHSQAQQNSTNAFNEESILSGPDFNGDGEYTTRLISYDCEENKSVELYSLEGEGHTWWKKSWGHDINTSELIWQFFQSQQ